MANQTHKIEFRTATLADAELVFGWSNDPLVRSQSFNTEPIVWENHEKWFAKKLSSANDLLLVLLVDEVPAGLVRFENIAEKCVGGILLSQEFRGRGLAADVIIKASEVFFAQHKQPIHAYIKTANVASVKSFEKAGYSFLKSSEVCGVPSVEYIKNASE